MLYEVITHPVALELFLELVDFLQPTVAKVNVKTNKVLNANTLFISICLSKLIKFWWCNIRIKLNTASDFSHFNEKKVYFTLFFIV